MLAKKLHRLQITLFSVVYLSGLFTTIAAINYAEPYSLKLFDTISSDTLFQFIAGAIVLSSFFFFIWIYFNFFYLPTMKYILTRAVVKTDLGPFTKETIQSIIEGKCSNCLSQINNSSIFCNSLIVVTKEIKVLCVECRTGKKLYINRSHSFDRVSRLIHLKIARDDHKINYLQLLLNLRLSYQSLSSDSADYSYIFNRNYINDKQINFDSPVNLMYNNIKFLDNCGECGTYWKNDFEEGIINDVVKKGKCPYCGLKNEFQWNMRTTFKEEYSIIKKESSVDT